jgi:hypothetical protein
MGISKKDLKNTEPGICIGCGYDTRNDQYKDRDTGGFCNACHNSNYRKYKQDRKVHLSEMRKKGVEFWEKLGIKPGDMVQRFCLSWTGLGGITVYGIAKTGINGAYVTSEYQPGKLHPAGWKKADIRRLERSDPFS